METISLNNTQTNNSYRLKRRILELIFCIAVLPFLTTVYIYFLIKKLFQNEDIFIAEYYHGEKNKIIKIYFFNTTNIFIKNLPAIYSILKNDINLVGTALKNHNTIKAGFFSLWFVRQNSKMTNTTEEQCNKEYFQKVSIKEDIKILLKSFIVLIYSSQNNHFKNKIKLLDVVFDNLPIQNIINKINTTIQKNEKKSIFFVNADCLNKAYEDSEYKDILSKADIVLPDGSGINIGCNMINNPLKENLNGTDLLPHICKLSQKKGFKIYLLGAKEDTAKQMKKNLIKKYPQLQIVGTHHGYLNTKKLTNKVIKDINQKQTDILFVAMGVPNQEFFIDKYKDKLDTKVILGVGGLFDFYSNNTKRAPLFLREIGFEWIYRMIQEPQRMWKRYIIGNPKFLYRVYRYKKQQKHNILLDNYLNTYNKKTDFKIRNFLWKITLISKCSIKRVIDIIASIILLIVFMPIFLIVASIIRFESKGAVLFAQTRVGLKGKLFKMYKFRSMVQNAEELKQNLMQNNESKDGVIFKLKDDPRVTKFGKFIRKTSIDELPQLYNVLKGDMSLVGPRPPVLSEVIQYNLDDKKRLDAKPGITCIWQVSGRSKIPFKQQVQMDKEYIKDQSFIKDITLLFKTIPAVLFSKGSY